MSRHRGGPTRVGVKFGLLQRPSGIAETNGAWFDFTATIGLLF